MSTSKKLVISSVFTAIASIVLYCSILFQEIDIIEFDFLPVLLFSAQAFLILTLVFIICAILISKGILNHSNIKKIIITLTSITLVVCILLIGYNGITFYDGYTPEDILNNDRVFAQSFCPYHNIDDSDTYVSVSHISGTDYLTLDSRGVNESGLYLVYNIEYFESLSPVMNFKFYIERGILTFSDIKYIGSFTDCKKTEINGVKVSLFTKESSDDIGVYIKDGNKAIYAELDNDFKNPVDIESFVKTVSEQFEAIEKTVEEQTFLDIPFSDKFYRRVVKKLTD